MDRGPFKRFKTLKALGSESIKSKVPYYNLRPMKGFSLDLFKSANRDSIEGLILSLAISYNDSKDILWMGKMLDATPPDDRGAINEESGQWRAMRHYVSKTLLSNLHETIELLRNNELVLNSEDFRKIEFNMPLDQKVIWDTLKATALDDNYPNSDLKRKLLSIRHKVSFHYDSNDNLKKFKEALTSYDGPGYVSLGNSIDNTRYFFADLTFEAYKKNLEMDEVEMDQLFKEVNGARHIVIVHYLKSINAI